MKLSLLTLLGATLLATSTEALYDRNGPVVQLTAKNFNEEVMNNGHLVAVEFYAPWCGHCQRLAPAWKKAAANLGGLVKVAAIDCDEDQNKPICSQYGIQGFPTIKTFSPRADKSKKGNKSVGDYQGPREAKPIVDYLLSVQPSNVRFVKGDAADVKSKKSIALDDFLDIDNSTLPKALLFTDKATTTPLYKALSVDFQDRMLFGEVKSSVKRAVNEFGVNGFPTLIVLTPESGAITYGGKLKHDALYKFLEEHAIPAPSKKKGGNSQKSKTNAEEPIKEAAEEPFDPAVPRLTTQKDLSEHCLDKSGICVIGILPTVFKEDERSASEQADAIKVMEGIKKAEHDKNGRLSPFLFQWVESELGQDIVSKFDMSQDYPTLVAVKPNKNLYRPYVGAWSDVSIRAWLDMISNGRLPVWDYKGDPQIKAASQPARDEL
ncbi:hypothetical protein K450DRAFT_241645 [Umbelopsis ramanniana AG]|uniref:protein disulfide-isomerase n=1 Tax=Umbelopsis ramanniana AG TaxID=1314678 RepID=A0AAD5EAZ4_UMBRA|nr:uncharacterized protein K450DRAFT_241645 [Umbelopsis ramanniana AG]KAI8579575.1 hypothetical protein K450DRAFT_241645 [Umbelopsis ramanniana AG]